VEIPVPSTKWDSDKINAALRFANKPAPLKVVERLRQEERLALVIKALEFVKESEVSQAKKADACLGRLRKLSRSIEKSGFADVSGVEKIWLGTLFGNQALDKLFGYLATN
jgi:hypothetical protein